MINLLKQIIYKLTNKPLIKRDFEYIEMDEFGNIFIKFDTNKPYAFLNKRLSQFDFININYRKIKNGYTR